MIKLKEGLEEYKLELIFYGEEIEMFRKIFKEAQESHVLWCEEEDERPESDSVVFRIYCSTTSFANAYYHLGMRVCKEIVANRICRCKVNHAKGDNWCPLCGKPLNEKTWSPTKMRMK